MSTKLDLSLDITASSAQDIKEWVQKSKQRQEEEKKLRVPKHIHDDEEEEEEDADVSTLRPSKKQKSSNMYNSQHLKGLQIMHGLKDFEVGKEVILTLADTSVLAKDDDGKILGMAEEEDVLENVNFAEKERLVEAERLRKRLKQSRYTGYDDAEFDDSIAPGTKPSILSQYDKEKKRAPKLVLRGDNSQTGIAGEEAEGGSLEERNKDYLKRKYESLQMELKPASSSFLTQEEVKFRKGPKARKKPNLRKALEAEGEEETTETVEAQEMKPKARLESFNFDDEDPELSLALAKARQLALQKRQQSAASTASKSHSEKMEVEQHHSLIESKEDDDNDRDLDAGAKIARQLALSAATPAADIHKTTPAETITQDDLEDVDVEGRRANGKLIFNSTTEFTTRLQARLNEHARSKAEAALREIDRQTNSHHSHHRQSSESESMDITESSLQMKKGRGSVDSSLGSQQGIKREREAVADEEEEEEELGESRAREREEREEAYDWEGSLNDEELTMGTTSMSKLDPDELEDEQLAFLHQQPVLNKGIAGALELLRSSGELKKVQKLAGRAKDDRSNDPSKEISDGIVLEYRDEYGRKLTQKEAFRQLSYKFHGYGPGKKHQEKRLKALEAERKMNKARSNILSGNAGTLKALTQAQEATGKAHIVVQGASAPAALVSKIAATKVQQSAAHKK